MSPAARPRRPAPALRERADALFGRLVAAQPEPVCELDFHTPYELLVATILSAQSTDRMVNKVTPTLFARWPVPAALAAAPQEAVEEVVKATGFFRQKAKNIRETSRLLVERHAGEVPQTTEALVALPGVARKTANVVLGTAFRIPSGVTVDTHAGRVARRLGLTRHEDPVKVEQALCALLPPEAWIDGGHRLVLHGRYVCTARRPDCARCPLNELCPSAEAPAEGAWETRAEGERRLVESRGTDRAV
ncbi:MAG: glycosylase and apyrimidinic lyase [Pseudomonadota bacterium]|jgi:endonuclease-3